MARMLGWLLVWLLCPLCYAQTIYTWTDNQGVVHFSDNPAPVDAKNPDSFFMPDHHQASLNHQVELATPVLKDKKNALSPETKKGQPTRLTLRIASPQHEQTIRDNRGQIEINAEINRKLMVGEQLQLLLDGENYGAPQTQPRWELNNIDRGTHTFAIKALISGKLIASTEAITVHLHRATVK